MCVLRGGWLQKLFLVKECLLHLLLRHCQHLWASAPLWVCSPLQLLLPWHSSPDHDPRTCYTSHGKLLQSLSIVCCKENQEMNVGQRNQAHFQEEWVLFLQCLWDCLQHDIYMVFPLHIPGEYHCRNWLEHLLDRVLTIWGTSTDHGVFHEDKQMTSGPLGWRQCPVSHLVVPEVLHHLWCHQLSA